MKAQFIRGKGALTALVSKLRSALARGTADSLVAERSNLSVSKGDSPEARGCTSRLSICRVSRLAKGGAACGASGLERASRRRMQSLLWHVSRLEQQVSGLQDVVDEHERHLKEFVIEKVIDLEDELREMGIRQEVSNVQGTQYKPSADTTSLVSNESFNNARCIEERRATCESTAGGPYETIDLVVASKPSPNGSRSCG